jgi:thiol-disulfide isomerase/thioredoxin
MTTRQTQPDNQTPPPTRRGLLWSVAATAAAAGLGLAVWRGGLFGRPAAPLAPGWWDTQWDGPQGEPVLLAAFKGRPLVINFWATWCAPCVEEMPLLDAFYRENKAKNWQMIGIAIDQPSSVRRFLGQYPVSYPIALGGLQGTEWGKALGNAQGGLPFTVVLNANGDVIAQYLGKLKEDQIKSWPSLAA